MGPDGSGTRRHGLGAAVNTWTHPWTNPAMRDENRLWKAEVEEGLSLEDLLKVLGELEKKALGERIHGR
jgi:hypothetical protein